MVLETTHRTPSGTAVVVDALAVGRNERGHELGPDAPGALLRKVTGVNGEVVFELEFAPRPEYGLISCTATARRTASTARRARFLLCTFWLAQALALAKEVDEANARSAPD